jgi:hypothetical protein
MKLYKRQDFMKLPAMTIYSRINESELCVGLFCKTDESTIDFVKQDLISECGYPDDNIDCGTESWLIQMNLRDTFQEFRTDLECAGRDGCFDNEDKFVVWDKQDITKLRDYLSEVLEKK